MRLILCLAGLVSAVSALAQDEFESAPPPPEIPQTVPEPSVPDTRAEEPLPEVTIIRRGEEVVTEYRMHGQLYAVKITPAKGPPYFLVDRDGDGSLETRRNDLDSPPIPEWTILRW